MRAWVACAALAATLFGHQAAAQGIAEPPVESPQLPPEAPKSSPIIQVPLPTEPPPPPPVVEKRKPSPPAVEKPAPAAIAPKRVAPAAAPAPEPALKSTAECVIKPVMTDDELRACGARP
jgi:outer membrane biosynthesis protein TonB